MPGGPTLPTRGTTTVTRPDLGRGLGGDQHFRALFAAGAGGGNNAVATDAGSIEMVDVTTGNTLFTTTALEGQLSTVNGNGRAVINGRALVVDTASTTAYMLTTSGITVAPMTPVNAATAPQLQKQRRGEYRQYAAEPRSGRPGFDFRQESRPGRQGVSSANPLPTTWAACA